ncbi:MAG: RNA polymerase sigma factor [Spirochaetota bacterium]
MTELSSDKDGLRRFNDAFTVCYDVLFRFVCGKTGSFEAAEDICQELFLRLYRKIDDVENPRAWLYGACRLVMCDYYREKGRKEDDIEALCDDGAVSYANGFQDTRILIEQALDAPGIFESETDRALFDMIALSGYTYADAARSLGVSYRQAHYGFEMVSRRIVSWFKSRGVSSLEELL